MPRLFQDTERYAPASFIDLQVAQEIIESEYTWVLVAQPRLYGAIDPSQQANVQQIFSGMFAKDASV
jgi:hypothetical protein